MAKVNKAQAVRDFLQDKPNSKLDTVIKAMAAKGIEVDRTFVSAVRFGMRTPNSPQRHKP